MTIEYIMTRTRPSAHLDLSFDSESRLFLFNGDAVGGNSGKAFFVSDPQFAGGAKGDGVTDDTAAWQAFLNAVDSVNGVGYYGPGPYKITSTITFPTGAYSLFGPRHKSIRIGGEGQADQGFMWYGLSNDVAVEVNQIQRSYIDSINVNNTINRTKGTHDGSNNVGTLTDSGESWIVDQWVGLTVLNVTDGSSGTITANDSTTVTATLSGGTDNDWDTGDEYWIYASGVTGVLMHNSQAGAAAANHNRFGTISVTGCNVGLQIGDFTNDGYHSNFDDNWIEEYWCFNTDEPFIMDSTGQDNNTIGYFHAGGEWEANGGWLRDETRAHLVYLKSAGIDNRIIEGYGISSGIITDNALIFIDDGSMHIDKFGIEGSQLNCQVLNVSTSTMRNRHAFRNIIPEQGMRDSSGISYALDAYSGVTLYDCVSPGYVRYDRDAAAIGTTFMGTTGGFQGTHDGAGNASVLTDTGASWTTDALIGLLVTNATDGSSGIITDNTGTTVTATLTGGTDNDWDASDQYYIGNAGTHDGGANQSSMTDSTASFTVDALIGLTITNVTDGSTGLITDNTATNITATLSGGTDNDWDDNDVYTIEEDNFRFVDGGTVGMLAEMGSIYRDSRSATNNYSVIAKSVGHADQMADVTGALFVDTKVSTCYRQFLNANNSVHAPGPISAHDIGTELELHLITDGSARTPAWNAVYLLAGGTVGAAGVLSANTYNIYRFRYNGTNWVETARSEDVS